MFVLYRILMHISSHQLYIYLMERYKSCLYDIDMRTISVPVCYSDEDIHYKRDFGTYKLDALNALILTWIHARRDDLLTKHKSLIMTLYNVKCNGVLYDLNYYFTRTGKPRWYMYEFPNERGVLEQMNNLETLLRIDPDDRVIKHFMISYCKNVTEGNMKKILYLKQHSKSVKVGLFDDESFLWRVVVAAMSSETLDAVLPYFTVQFTALHDSLIQHFVKRQDTMLVCVKHMSNLLSLLDENGSTLLMNMIMHHAPLNVIKSLVDAEANPHVVNKFKDSVLHILCGSAVHDINILHYFLDLGVLADRFNVDGRSPLMCATYYRKHEFVKALFNAGANPLVSPSNAHPCAYHYAHMKCANGVSIQDDTLTKQLFNDWAAKQQQKN